MERAQQVEDLDGAVDAGTVGPRDEVEIFKIADAEFRHAQHYLRQVGAVNFLHGKQGPVLEVVAREEAVTITGGGTPGPALALVAGSLTDGDLDQAGGEGLGVVEVEFSLTGIDDAGDAVDGHRSFGDVGGHDDLVFAFRRLFEDPLLFVLAEARIQRYQVQLFVYRAGGQNLHDRLDGLLAGQENQQVAGPLRSDDAVDDILDLGDQRFQVGLQRRRIDDDGDRIDLGVDLDQRAIAEVGAKDIGVDGGAGDDNLELGAGFEHPLEQAEDEVDVQAALVGFVDHDDRVAAKQRVELHLLEQDAVGHDLDLGIVVGLILETHLVADQARHGRGQLPTDEFRDRNGGDAAGLGDADDTMVGIAGLMENDRQLGGLAGTGRTLDDDDLILGQGVEDGLFLLVDW